MPIIVPDVFKNLIPTYNMQLMEALMLENLGPPITTYKTHHYKTFLN